MLKKLIYISIAFYLFVIYGQNMLEFGTDLRMDFYFIGMSISRLLFSICLYKAYKHSVTSFFLFLCCGDLANELFFDANLSYIELVSGVLGTILLLFYNRFKNG